MMVVEPNPQLLATSQTSAETLLTPGLSVTCAVQLPAVVLPQPRGMLPDPVAV